MRGADALRWGSAPGKGAHAVPARCLKANPTADRLIVDSVRYPPAEELEKPQ